MLRDAHRSRDFGPVRQHAFRILAVCTAISVNAGISDKVSLRGLTLTGRGADAVGIALRGGSLDIIDCVVRNFVTVNIDIRPQFGGQSNIVNTVVSGAGSSQSGDGVRVMSGRGLTVLSISRSSLIGNAASGLNVTAGSFPSVCTAAAMSCPVISTV